MKPSTSGNARLFELFDIRPQTCREHYQNDADFGKERQPFHCGVREQGLVGNEFDKTQQNARDDHTDDLRKAQFFTQ